MKILVCYLTRKIAELFPTSIQEGTQAYGDGMNLVAIFPHG